MKKQCLVLILGISILSYSANKVPMSAEEFKAQKTSESTSLLKNTAFTVTAIAGLSWGLYKTSDCRFVRPFVDHGTTVSKLFLDPFLQAVRALAPSEKVQHLTIKSLEKVLDYQILSALGLWFTGNVASGLWRLNAAEEKASIAQAEVALAKKQIADAETRTNAAAARASDAEKRAREAEERVLAAEAKVIAMQREAELAKNMEMLAVQNAELARQEIYFAKREAVAAREETALAKNRAALATERAILLGKKAENDMAEVLTAIKEAQEREIATASEVERAQERVDETERALEEAQKAFSLAEEKMKQEVADAQKKAAAARQDAIAAREEAAAARKEVAALDSIKDFMYSLYQSLLDLEGRLADDMKVAQLKQESSVDAAVADIHFLELQREYCEIIQKKIRALKTVLLVADGFDYSLFSLSEDHEQEVAAEEEVPLTEPLTE